MNKRFLLILLVLILVTVSGHGDSTTRKVTICYTNSLNGYLDYCQCKEEDQSFISVADSNVAR